jgi:hypothetical protein
LAVIVFLVIGLRVPIGLAGFELHGSQQQRKAPGAGSVLLFGRIIKESKPESPLKVSQSSLAEMVGTTRARVSKFKKRFRKKGLVRYSCSLQVNSPLVIGFLQSRRCPPS